jgi:hypothetical protein
MGSSALGNLEVFCTQHGRKDTQKVDQTEEDGMETSRRLKIRSSMMTFGTLKNDEINVETSELREFYSDDVRNLCCILG